jgi:hypothetical protein
MADICGSTSIGITPLLACVNEATNGMFGLSIVMGVWMLLYFRLRGVSSPKDAIAAASFISFLVAALLRLLGAIDDIYLGITFVLLAGSLAMLAYSRR